MDRSFDGMQHIQPLVQPPMASQVAQPQQLLVAMPGQPWQAVAPKAPPAHLATAQQKAKVPTGSRWVFQQATLYAHGHVVAATRPQGQ